jgi:putative transposase
VLLRLAYLTVTNTFALMRLLPASDRDKDTEILVLRHQITVLERQLGEKKARFTSSDRAFLAALLHRLRPEVLRRMRLLVRPDTVLRWHRDLIRGQYAARSHQSGREGWTLADAQGPYGQVSAAIARGRRLIDLPS